MKKSYIEILLDNYNIKTNLRDCTSYIENLNN